MASEQEVKQYLAYWFQLGKKVYVRNGQDALQPTSILNNHGNGNGYSYEFEACWQQIRIAGMGNCYLEGTNQTLAEMLTQQWEISACARCEMPVPVQSAGIPDPACPCDDLPTWPNTELPQPRSPIASQSHLLGIRDRLLKLDSSSDASVA